MVLNRSTFSKIHGVSRAAITLAVQSGALVSDAIGMIDDEHETNRAWIDRRKGKASASEKNQAPKVEKKNPPAKVTKPKSQKTIVHQNDAPEEVIDDGKDIDDIPDEPDNETYQDYGSLTIQKLHAEIRFKHEQADTALQKRLERLGELVDKETVSKAFGQLGAEIKIRLLEMPERITPRIVAMVKSGTNEKEIQTFFEAEISAAIREIKARSIDYITGAAHGNGDA